MFFFFFFFTKFTSWLLEAVTLLYKQAFKKLLGHSIIIEILLFFWKARIKYSMILE